MPFFLFQSVLLLVRVGTRTVGSFPANERFATSVASITIFFSVAASRSFLVRAGALGVFCFAMVSFLFRY